MVRSCGSDIYTLIHSMIVFETILSMQQKDMHFHILECNFIDSLIHKYKFIKAYG